MPIATRRTRKKVQVPLAGQAAGRVANMEDGATRGATIGEDLFYADGSIVTLASLAIALGVGASAPSSALPLARTIWRLIQEVPIYTDSPTSPNWEYTLDGAAIGSVGFAAATNGITTGSLAGDLVLRPVSGRVYTRSDIWLNVDGATIPSAAVNPDARFVIADDVALSGEMVRAGDVLGSLGFRFVAAGGTFAAPTAVTVANTSYMGYIGGAGHDGTTWQTGSAGLVGIRPDGTWSAVSRPTRVTIEATLAASVTRTLIATFKPGTGGTQFDNASVVITAASGAIDNGWTLNLVNANPGISWRETDAAANAKNWDLRVSSTLLLWGIWSDDYLTNANFMRVLRTTTTVDEIEFNATLFDVHANIVASGSIQWNGGTLNSSTSSFTSAISMTRANPAITFIESDVAADNQIWQIEGGSATVFTMRTLNDAQSTARIFFQVNRSGVGVTQIALGNGTDIPPIFMNGTLRLSNLLTAAVTNVDNPIIYSTTGTGVGDFAAAGTLHIQPRSSAARDIVLFAGSTTPGERLRIHGATSSVSLPAGVTLQVGYQTAALASGFSVAGTGATSFGTFARFQASSTPATIQLQKSRNATIGSHTIVNDTDELGALTYWGSDGVGFIIAAGIYARVDGVPGVNDMPTRLEFYTTADGAAALTERMRIDAEGDVNVITPGARFVIGTTGNPFGGLSVNGSASNSTITSARYGADSNAPQFQGVKSRNATIGLHTIVQNGDGVLALVGFGSDGVGHINAASIRYEIDGVPGVNDMPGRIVFLTVPDGSAVLAERGRISNDGVMTMLGPVIAPVHVGSYATGSFTAATGKFVVQVARMTLTGTQRATLQGTARLRIF